MRAGWAFVTPALALILVFFAFPVVAAVGLSVTDFDVYAIADLANLRVVGFENFRRLLADPRFGRALANTTTFVVVGGATSIAASLGAALALSAPGVRWRGFFRAVYFAPVVTTLVAVAVVWRALLHARIGPVNQVLGAIGIAPVDWLGDPDWAMRSIILLAVWKGFGFNMIVFLAGLQAIPVRLYEAARLDGAGAWQQFRHVTLPLLAPTLVFVTLMTVIGHFQLFAEPYVMTRGGPGDATLSVVLLMYEQGFRWWNLGYASAVAFVLFGIILAVTSVQIALRGRMGVRGSEVG